MSAPAIVRAPEEVGLNIELAVRRGCYVRTHARFESHGSTRLDLSNGRTYKTHSRGFSCECGGQLRDGDRVYDGANGEIWRVGCEPA